MDMIEEYFEEDTQKHKYLTFMLGSEAYGIEIKYITEIIGLQPITEVPELPSYIRGIVNLRGKIIPVMDVRLKFNKPFREYNDRTCVIVVDVGDMSIGLIVDSVSDVLLIAAEEIVQPPKVNKAGNNFVKGIGRVGDEVKLILDCNKLLNGNEIEDLENI